MKYPKVEGWCRPRHLHLSHHQLHHSFLSDRSTFFWFRFRAFWSRKQYLWAHYLSWPVQANLFPFRSWTERAKLIRTNPLLKICPRGSSAHLHPSWYLQRNAYRLKMCGRIWQMSESSIFQHQVNSRYIKFLLLSFKMPGLRDSFSSLSAFCLHRRKSWLKLGHAMANLKIL